MSNPSINEHDDNDDESELKDAKTSLNPGETNVQIEGGEAGKYEALADETGEQENSLEDEDAHEAGEPELPTESSESEFTQQATTSTNVDEQQNSDQKDTNRI